MLIKKRMINRKAQEEMFGFVLVILLITIMIVAFLFVASKGQDKPIARENLRVSNLLNSMMYFTSECEDKDLSELIISCGNQEFGCDDYGGVCEYAETLSREIIKEFLKGDYSFTVKKEFDDETIINVDKGICPGNRIALKSISILPYASGVIEIELYSCPIPVNIKEN